MYVIDTTINNEIVYIKVCDVCGLPLEEELNHAYHIHHDCYWSLEKIHAPGSEETLKSLGFKEYNDPPV